MSNRGIENYELLSSMSGTNIIYEPPDGQPYQTRNCNVCGSHDTITTPTNYIEYWKCSSYAFYNEDRLNDLNSISSRSTIINDRKTICNTHSSNLNNIRNTYESLTYITGSSGKMSADHPIGYRYKDQDRTLNDQILDENNSVLSNNFIKLSWINALSTSLSTEIRARLLNYLYSDKTDSINALINDLVPNENFIDGNIIEKLRDAMNLLSSGVSVDTEADLQEAQSVIPNAKNISTVSTDIAKTEVSSFISDCNIAYKDCICYSDCGGYAVCFCYGNCNYY